MHVPFSGKMHRENGRHFGQHNSLRRTASEAQPHFVLETFATTLRASKGFLEFLKKGSRPKMTVSDDSNGEGTTNLLTKLLHTQIVVFMYNDSSMNQVSSYSRTHSCFLCTPDDHDFANDLGSGVRQFNFSTKIVFQDNHVHRHNRRLVRNRQTLFVRIVFFYPE